MSSDWLYASLLQFCPTLGAPSLSTRSTLNVLMCFLMAALHFSVVMSSCRQMTLGIGAILTMSTQMIMDEVGHVFAHTCDHEPGAPHRSSTTRALPSRSYFLLSWISLNDARDRNPCSLARW